MGKEGKSSGGASSSSAMKSVKKQDKKASSSSSSKPEKKETLAGNKIAQYLDRDLIKYYEKLAEHYGISQVARGDAKAKTTDCGFLEVYRNNSDKDKLIDIPVRKTHPNGANWKQTRENRVSAKLAQMVKMAIPWFHTSGKLEGLPTKMHCILIMWAYSPHTAQLESLRKGKMLEKKL
ncbi:unnamed protein product [Amoebophrya sp. A25]|nr:unnamed protein product [Amoebophrya sp. A25]|eukprot:GSA25T00000678001.1